MSAEKLRSLPREKIHAFLGLFAGARQHVIIFTGPNGERRTPHFGKAECEIDDWENFYTRELPALGLAALVTTSEPRPALGMADGWTWVEARVDIADEGWDAREAYYDE